MDLDYIVIALAEKRRLQHRAFRNAQISAGLIVLTIVAADVLILLALW